MLLRGPCRQSILGQRGKCNPNSWSGSRVPRERPELERTLTVRLIADHVPGAVLRIRASLQALVALGHILALRKVNKAS